MASQTEQPIKPYRVQLSRKKGYKLPPNSVIVDRRTIWGNQFKVGGKTQSGLLIKTQSQAVEEHRRWLTNTQDGRDRALYAQRFLRGKNLACWCGSDEPCHADNWLKVANL